MKRRLTAVLLGLAMFVPARQALAAETSGRSAPTQEQRDEMLTRRCQIIASRLNLDSAMQEKLRVILLQDATDRASLNTKLQDELKALRAGSVTDTAARVEAILSLKEQSNAREMKTYAALKSLLDSNRMAQYLLMDRSLTGGGAGGPPPTGQGSDQRGGSQWGHGQSFGHAGVPPEWSAARSQRLVTTDIVP